MTNQTADLPARLEAVLTERYTSLGNPFSRMRRQEKGPDGWPAEYSVGPHHVAEVLRELLADEQPAANQAALLPAWEAVYEPGNVSTYLIGYANDQDAATGMAEAWMRSQAEVTGRLEWVDDEQMATGRYDRWFELIECHGDGVDTGTSIVVRRRVADETQPAEATDEAEALWDELHRRDCETDQPHVTDSDRVVAYRSAGGRLLRCLDHHPGQDQVDRGNFHPVTSDDLPDGGLCTYPDCGVDVLIPQPAAGARQDETTALDLLPLLASPEPCHWDGPVCTAHLWRSDIGRCPHAQAQKLLGGEPR